MAKLESSTLGPNLRDFGRRKYPRRRVILITGKQVIEGDSPRSPDGFTGGFTGGFAGGRTGGVRRRKPDAVALYSGRGESLADRVLGQFGDAVQVELAHDIAAMRFDGVLRNVHPCRDFG